jgi:hypothetical protein
VEVEVLDRSLERAVIRGDVRTGEPVIVARPSRLMTLAGGTRIVEAGQP